MSDTAQTHGQVTDTGKSKFIRTYAKDVAALTGTQASTPPPQTPPPAPEPKKPSPWEMPEATREVADLYNAPEPAVDKERERTLARLRDKVGRSAHMEIETMAPPSPLPTPPPPPPPPPKPEPEPEPEKPARLHTYKSDFAEHIDEKQASAFSVLAAEADAKKKPTRAARPLKTPAMLAALVIVFGVGGVLAAVWYVQNAPSAPISPLSVPSLVFADERMKLTGSGQELMQALATAADGPLVEGNVLITYLSESTTTPKGGVIETPLAGGALIKALQLPAPDILLRNVSEASTVGIVNAGGQTRPFFIFRVSSYERTFAGMLAWEATLGRDLALIYPSYSAPAINPEAQVVHLATSTPAESAGPPAALSYFADAVVSNHDARILRDTGGNTLMLYGYADKATLILARNEAAFAALLTRLSAASSQ